MEERIWEEEKEEGEKGWRNSVRLKKQDPLLFLALGQISALRVGKAGSMKKGGRVE